MLISGGRMNWTVTEVSVIPSSPVLGSPTSCGITSESVSGSIASTGAI